MTNAAIFLHTDALDTTRPRLLGRHSAGESFLRGFLRHADVEAFYLWHGGGSTLEELQALVGRIEPVGKPIRWLRNTERARLAEVGALNLPGPSIDDEAWARQPYKAASYSICGLTHTTATARTMTTLSNLLIAPVEAHDALICTSAAVRASVETQLEGVRDYLAAEYGGPRRRAELQRVVIPLGVNARDFAASAEHRQVWRERLDIPADAAVALYVGRFNAREKMNPALMALSLERAAQRLDQPLYWVNSGWAGTEAEAELFHDQTRALCPSVHYRVVDGRPPDTRFSIWSAADFFISFSDNIQESFGLTPVEAMAAGLPCVVTDWDGYRDTVRHGLDGFRVDTTAPGPGSGFDLTYWHAAGWSDYSAYVGAAAQYTAIDFRHATDAICALAASPELRRTLGAQAAQRAREVFDWSAVVPQYQALWGELAARRRAAPQVAGAMGNPFRPDPFTLYASYPTRHLADGWRATLCPDMDWPAAQAVLSRPLAAYGYINRPNAAECEKILAWLAERPGAQVSEIVELFPAFRRPAIARGLLWIARFGVIELRPGG
ncbi:glycosyltransferase family 4 protein [Phenylobacterium sp.]|uniref:glycosyltransferase family 4 protein n=1 Tax=Phenylobacterium sp. TaxID=1871053 RepID=UPI001209B576|nr:glycosyltransferase family 4 protein [Phenylobacterium sp.]THD58906.1 MAG: glycosyltransferase [Phenylobacterium sp.]